MQFTPKSKEELTAGALLPDGIYDFTVLSAENDRSKKGNDMIKLKVCIYAGEREVHLYDYLMEAMLWKLQGFCESCGLLDKYEAGTLEAFDCDGVSAKAEIITEKDKTGQFPPRNAIKRYRAAREEAASAPAAKPKPAPVANDIEDDDIPFN